jgi:hypothetical protein
VTSRRPDYGAVRPVEEVVVEREQQRFEASSQSNQEHFNFYPGRRNFDLVLASSIMLN